MENLKEVAKEIDNIVEEAEASVISNNNKYIRELSKNGTADDEQNKTIAFDEEVIIVKKQQKDVESVPESKIPVSANKTSTPIKTKTIKKHSKVNREIIKSTAQHRPNVGDIDWDMPATNQVSSSDETEPKEENIIKEFSTLNLEDVSSPNEQRSFDPIIIISPSEEYSGEIDEVYLIQTLDDSLEDEVDKNGFNVKDVQQRQQQQQQKPTIITTDDDLQTMSLSMNSESDSESHGEVNFNAERRTEGVGSAEEFTNSSSRCGEKTFGSSSGSDVALHEPGAELSDDDETGIEFVFFMKTMECTELFNAIFAAYLKCISSVNFQSTS